MSFESDGKFFVFRLRPHEDLKNGLMMFAQHKAIKAGAVVSCVGSLEQVSIRFANQTNAHSRAGHFEILSLVGTFSASAAHLHISVADNEGKTIGGHLLPNNLVFTTAEIVVVTFPNLEFAREKDDGSGYQELVVKQTGA